MITGIILIIVGIVSLIIILKTDLENEAIEHKFSGRIKVYFGILILIIIGIYSIIRDI